MPADTTSPALAAEGTLLQVDIGGGSAPVWTTIANVGDITGPAYTSTEVDVTSHSSQAPFRRRIITLLDIGPVSFKCFWVPQNPTHSSTVVGAIRWAYENRIKQVYRLLYTDGVSFDEFNAYVKDLNSTAAVAGVYEMKVTLSATDYPLNMA